MTDKWKVIEQIILLEIYVSEKTNDTYYGKYMRHIYEKLNEIRLNLNDIIEE